MLKIYIMFNLSYSKNTGLRESVDDSLAMLGSVCKPSTHLSRELKSNLEDSETSSFKNGDVVIRRFR